MTTIPNLERPKNLERSESLYETDFYTWANQQAAALRSGQTHLLDHENIAEEMETLGRSEAAALRSSYRLICMHLLMLIHQPEKATRSLEATILRERLNAVYTLDENPGLKPRRDELFRRAYAFARKEASIETGIPVGRFPEDPPFTIGEIESEDFWPAGFPKREVET